MNDMRGIKIRRIDSLGGLVPPIQGGGEWLGEGVLVLVMVLVLGLRAGRSTPSYHISGFQPSRNSGSMACKGDTRMSLSSTVPDRAFNEEL